MKKTDYEIPFGAKDSELKGWEYTIPEGMEAIIKDGKVIVREKQSEDEKIRKALIDGVRQIRCKNGITQEQMLVYLEKQKEPLTPEEKMKHPLYVEGFEAGKQVGAQYEAAFGKQKEQKDYRKLYEDIAKSDWFKKSYHGKSLGIEDEQKPTEWSEEDEDFINMLILHFNYLIDKGGDSVETYKSYREKLKSLHPQPKQKDRYQEGFQDGVYEGRRKALEEYNKSVAYPYEDFNHKLSCYEGGPCTNPFFDCIKCPRRDNGVVKTYTSPNTTEYQSTTQPSWKPSEEQMDALNALNCHGDLSYIGQQSQLISLYNDLKKL